MFITVCVSSINLSCCPYPKINVRRQSILYTVTSNRIFQTKCKDIGFSILLQMEISGCLLKCQCAQGFPALYLLNYFICFCSALPQQPGTLEAMSWCPQASFSPLWSTLPAVMKQHYLTGIAFKAAVGKIEEMFIDYYWVLLSFTCNIQSRSSRVGSGNPSFLLITGVWNTPLPAWREGGPESGRSLFLVF